MSGEGSRLEVLELRDRVSKLEKHFAELAKWTHFNLRENTKENNGAEGPVANVDGGTTEIVGAESTPGNGEKDGNQEGNVAPVYFVLVGDGNNYQQVRVDVIEKPHGNSSEETSPPQPNPEGGSFIEPQNQSNEGRESSTAAEGSVDGGANEGSKDEGAILREMKTEAVEVFYVNIKEEVDSDAEEDNSAIRSGSLESAKKRKRSAKKKSSTSGSTSLKKLARSSQTISKKNKTVEKSNNFKCPHCPKTFSWKSQLKYHLSCHSDKKSFNCPHCDHTTAWEISLKEHIRRMHKDLEQPVSAPTRGARGFWKNHKKDGELHCYFCSYKTKNSHNFVSHVRNHTGEKPFRCPRCSYAAKDNGALEYHLEKLCK